MIARRQIASHARVALRRLRRLVTALGVQTVSVVETLLITMRTRYSFSPDVGVRFDHCRHEQHSSRSVAEWRVGAARVARRRTRSDRGRLRAAHTRAANEPSQCRFDKRGSIVVVVNRNTPRKIRFSIGARSVASGARGV